MHEKQIVYKIYTECNSSWTEATPLKYLSFLHVRFKGNEMYNMVK